VIIRRYEIQMADLDETIKKSNINWERLRRTLTLNGAQEVFWELASTNVERVVFRVFDREKGKPVV